jgi:osmoprotectant transport system ATP-binding protein
MVLIGPSGCGKTTILRMINRLVEPSGGTILCEGQDTSRMDPVALRRRIGYVIQGIGLFPHMRVLENVSVVPRLKGIGPDEARSISGRAWRWLVYRRPSTVRSGQDSYREGSNRE